MEHFPDTRFSRSPGPPERSKTPPVLKEQSSEHSQAVKAAASPVSRKRAHQNPEEHVVDVLLEICLRMSVLITAGVFDLGGVSAGNE